MEVAAGIREERRGGGVSEPRGNEGQPNYSLYSYVCVSVIFRQRRQAGGSLEAAAQVHAADLVLELKCSTAVWLVSVP